MITVEEIREIAEGLGFKQMEGRGIKLDGYYWFSDGDSYIGKKFQPDTDWRDTGLVLEDLRVKVGIVEISGHTLSLHNYNEETGDSKCFFCEESRSLQESICRAWLAVNKQGE